MPKSMCRQAHVPSKALGKGAAFPLPALMVPGIPWLVATSPPPLPLSSRGLLCVFSSSKDLVVGFRAYLGNPEGSHLKILSLLMSVQMLFPNTFTITGFGGYLLRGYHPTHCKVCTNVFNPWASSNSKYIWEHSGRNC